MSVLGTCALSRCSCCSTLTICLSFISCVSPELFSSRAEAKAARGSKANAINQNKTAAAASWQRRRMRKQQQQTKAATAATTSLSQSTRNALFLSAAGIYQINGENVVGSLARLCACTPQFILIAFARTFVSFRSQRRRLPLLLLLLSLPSSAAAAAVSSQRCQCQKDVLVDNGHAERNHVAYFHCWIFRKKFNSDDNDDDYSETRSSSAVVTQ